MRTYTYREYNRKYSGTTFHMFCDNVVLFSFNDNKNMKNRIREESIGNYLLEIL